MVVPIAGRTAGERALREPERESARSARRESQPREEEEDEPPRRRGVPPILFAILAIVLFVGGIAYFLYTFLFQGLFKSPEEYTVPDLRGYTLEELNLNPSLWDGFDIVVGTTVYSEDYAADQVCEQSPEAGETVRAGSRTITVNISGSQDALYMIDVVNQDARTVVATLQGMGLKVDQQREYSNEITKGYVISSSLVEGTLVQEGDEVTIFISLGPDEVLVTVPSFLNVDFERVQNQLEVLGLTLGDVNYYPSDEYKENRVMWQSIANGEEVTAGTKISFQVSQGPATKASEEPSPEPTVEPTVEPSTEPSPEITLPADNMADPVSTKTVVVDLTGYTGSVTVRITVGSLTLLDGQVDSAVGSLSREVTASGSQTVNIYINGNLVSSYTEHF
jgi:serine/threonine-protein kinase